MQRLEVSGAVRPIYGSLGVKRLSRSPGVITICSGRHYNRFHKWLRELRLVTDTEISGRLVSTLLHTVKMGTIYRACFVLWPTNVHNYFTNYHIATCFDTIVSSSDSL